MLHLCNDNFKMTNKKFPAGVSREPPWHKHHSLDSSLAAAQRVRSSGVTEGRPLLPPCETMQQALEEQVQGGRTFRRATALLMMEPVTTTNAHVQALLNRSEDSATLLEALAQ